jgi:hypothetical protein
MNARRSPEAIPRRTLIFFGAVFLVTALIIYLLLSGNRFDTVAWSFGRPKAGGLKGWPIAIGILCGCVAAIAWAFMTNRRWIALSLLMGAGIAAHWAVPLSDGRGAAAMRERIWGVGHTEFIRIARDEPDLSNLAKRYEQLVAQKHWVFPRSKPPGCLQTYRVMIDCAKGPIGRAIDRVLFGPPPPVLRAAVDRQITAFLFVLLTFTSYLTILPTYFIARSVAGDRVASVAAALFVTTPSVTIVSMHFDNALYPLIGLTTLALMLLNGRGRYYGAVAAGIVLSLGAYISFSLLPLGLAAVLLPLAKQMPDDAQPLPHRLVPVAIQGLLFATAFIIVHGVLIVMLDYHVITRFRDATAFHAHWWSGGGHNWYVGNLIQFGLAMGTPLTIAFLWSAACSVREIAKPSSTSVVVLIVVFVLAATDFSGTAKSEVARLWAALNPLIAIAGAMLFLKWNDRILRWAIPCIAAIQFGYTVILYGVRPLP